MQIHCAHDLDYTIEGKGILLISRENTAPP